ncbi:MAG: type I DNA topoisomerase [Armatimonadetes bacterium]|nr:type I DNA topoisomerase [Armatimonadota bacterium]
MASKLVIVESPAKAKTIGGYLGKDYEVLASIGHIRDLVPNAKGLPPEVKKKWWADYGIDIDQDFEPYYEVPKEKAAQVSKLRAALKDKDELVLATDEDREGEAISWHLLEVLKPTKKQKVSRIAFHEITKDAIQRAVATPRTIDLDLVEAQETRRILDRLYGYTLSPVLWTKVTKNLSAGRVQSPAVKLVVEREKARRDFVSAEYWDLKAKFQATAGVVLADLVEVEGKRVAAGRDFDEHTGKLSGKADVLWVDGALAVELATAAKAAKPYVVESLTEKEGQQKPQPPFMTTTLQQDANRKFAYGAERTMRIAQTLYEGVEIGGETAGLITYMRTDSLTLAEDALHSIRGYIARHYPDAQTDKPVKYSNKVKNAQEAHEAIRPTDISRSPDKVRSFLTDDQFKIYSLIWQRTVACQMKPAKVLRTEAKIGSDSAKGHLVFQANGSQVVDPGFLSVYMEGKDEEDDGDRILPRMSQGQEVTLAELDPSEHHTMPPSRYTDATLIRRLEELGIGRPSTYASIISVIVDRGYVRKAGKQLVPTWRAFMAMDVLDVHFQELMDFGFTAKLDDVLDEISEGKADSKVYLKEFFMGDANKPGLKPMVEERRLQIPFPNLEIGKHPESGEGIRVRSGKDGSPFLQLGDQKVYANIPDDLAPADLTLEKALELFAQRSPAAEVVGVHPVSGRNLLLKFRQGYYLEAERTPEEIEAKVKPTWISLPPGITPQELSQEDLDILCAYPKLIGKDGSSEVWFRMGKFGPYVEEGTERRTIEDWRKGVAMTLEEAKAILAQPKTSGAASKKGPIKEMGELPGAAGPVRVMTGFYGPYVTDGVTNATIPKSIDPLEITNDQAKELLDKKREAGPSTKKRTFKRKATARKK